MLQRLIDRLETRWIAPAYSGWLIMGIAVFFFGAATNTLAGWLYVMSGVMFALLAIAAVLSPRNLQGIQVQRQPIRPTSAGSALLIDLTLENTTAQAKVLIQISDQIPSALGPSPEKAIAALKPHGTYQWRYELPTQRRGIYHWHHLQLRTAAPLGLFWSRRYHDGRVNAVVYPTILPLSHCPLLDQLGENSQFQWHQEQRTEAATEGLTRALRPYRWGDPTRLIHWRTSARYGELRVRELEHHTSGQSVTLALDTAATWDTEAFEQAVTALASLYHYALTLNLPVQLWTPKTGLLSERIAVLTTLAGVQIGDGQKGHSPRLPNLPLVWLASRNPDQPLPTGSRQIQWQSAIAPAQMSQDLRITIDPNQPLQPQLQQIL